MRVTTWKGPRIAAVIVSALAIFAAGCSVSSPSGGQNDTEGAARSGTEFPGHLGNGFAAVVAPATAAEVGAAIEATPGMITGAEIVTSPDPDTVTVSDTPLGGFPTAGDTYAILSSGRAADITQENSSGSSGSALGGAPVRGDSDFDVTIMRLDFTAAEGSNCLLGLDFRFLSEEYPEFVGASFNDAFIVELDNSTWTTSSSEISAPDNIAFDPANNVISVNAAGVTSVTAGNALGTTFDGATPLLRAATPLEPGPHSLYLSIFDQGDSILDSAVMIDNLRVGTVMDPATECVPGAEVAEPTASFTATPETGAAPLPVDFDASASFDPDGTIASYAWDFGNGSTGSGVTTSATYAAAGDYTVALTVEDNEGLTNTATKVITVTESSGENLPPTASFEVTPDTGVAPLTVTADASASTDTDGTVDAYAWDFGNGTTATGVTAMATYDTAGVYSVTLTVTDDDGATGTATKTVTVTEPEPPETGDIVSITVTGGIDYDVMGAATSGDIVVVNDDQGVRSIDGTVTIPGAAGGEATIEIHVSRFLFFPTYLGSVQIDDPGAGVNNGEIPILFRGVASSGDPQTVSGTAPWFVFVPPFALASISLSWSVTNVVV